MQINHNSNESSEETPLSVLLVIYMKYICRINQPRRQLSLQSKFNNKSLHIILYKQHYLLNESHILRTKTINKQISEKIIVYAVHKDSYKIEHLYLNNILLTARGLSSKIHSERHKQSFESCLVSLL